MFTGLSAFPLTALGPAGIDEAAVTRLTARLAEAGVDSIGALGSTGSYAYLTRRERWRVARLAVSAADGTPVIVGIGALRTDRVLELADDAQNAGAAGVLLAPMTYQPLTDDEVFGLYEDVTRHLSVPLCVYDNPGTTHVDFPDALHSRIAALPGVRSIKIPPVPDDPAAAAAWVRALRDRIPDTVTLGVSGDPAGAAGLRAGCDAWYSALAGTLPAPCLAVLRAAQRGDHDGAARISERLAPLWGLFRVHGSLRVVSAVAELLGLIDTPNLPRPVRGLGTEGRASVAAALDRIDDLIGA